MTLLNDSALERLREAADAPELEGTRYRLIERLGQGGMGGVFRVEDVTLEREIALKVIHFDDGGGGLSARLLQEARVIARLEHPGIVPVHDAGTLPDGRPYYTMKFVHGRRLDEHVGNVRHLGPASNLSANLRCRGICSCPWCVASRPETRQRDDRPFWGGTSDGLGFVEAVGDSRRLRHRPGATKSETGSPGMGTATEAFSEPPATCLRSKAGGMLRSTSGPTFAPWVW